MRRKPAALRNIGIDLHAQALASFRCGYDVALVRGCAQRFLETLTVRSVYGDPPYLWETRKSDRRYLHDDTDTDHAVMIAGYPSALHDERLATWAV